MTESRWRNGKQGVVANRSQAHATDSTAIANRQFSLYNLIDKLCQNSEIFDRLPIALTSFLIHSISKHLWLQPEHHCLSTVRWSMRQDQENKENPRNSRRRVKPCEEQATQLTLIKSSDSSSLLQLSFHPTMCCYIEETRVDLNYTNLLSFHQCWEYASTCQIQTLIWCAPKKEIDPFRSYLNSW